MMINDFINDFVYKAGKDLRCLEGLFAVGSQLHSTPTTDLDFIFVSSCKRSEAQELIANFIKNNFSYKHINKLDDSVQIQFNNFNFPIVSFGVYERNEIESLVNRFLTGENVYGVHRPWATGYWVPEALMADIVNAKPLIAEDLLLSLKSKLTPYPAIARQAIITLCNEEIQIKSKKEGQDWKSILNRKEVILAKYREIFAKQGVYLNGFKDLQGQATRSGNGELIKLIDEFTLKIS